MCVHVFCCVCFGGKSARALNVWCCWCIAGSETCVHASITCMHPCCMHPCCMHPCSQPCFTHMHSPMHAPMHPMQVRGTQLQLDWNKLPAAERKWTYVVDRVARDHMDFEQVRACVVAAERGLLGAWLLGSGCQPSTR